LTVTDKQTIRKKTQYKSQKYTHKHNTNQRKQTTKHTAETKLPWFSRLLWHSERKRGGLILQWPRAIELWTRHVLKGASGWQPIMCVHGHNVDTLCNPLWSQMITITVWTMTILN